MQAWAWVGRQYQDREVDRVMSLAGVWDSEAGSFRIKEGPIGSSPSARWVSMTESCSPIRMSTPGLTARAGATPRVARLHSRLRRGTLTLSSSRLAIKRKPSTPDRSANAVRHSMQPVPQDRGAARRVFNRADRLDASHFEDIRQRSSARCDRQGTIMPKLRNRR
jgi:hypothetical protein